MVTVPLVIRLSLRLRNGRESDERRDGGDRNQLAKLHVFSPLDKTIKLGV
jgi:hypothetical protein